MYSWHRLGVASQTQAPRRWIEAEQRRVRPHSRCTQKPGTLVFSRPHLWTGGAAPWESGRGVPEGSLEGGVGFKGTRFGEQVVCVRPALGSPAPDQGLCR